MQHYLSELLLHVVLCMYMLYEVIDYMKLRIRESSGSGNTYFKNVDICDLPSILKKGILSMNASGNDNWDSGKRANNSRDVVYLFRPTGYENSFVQYGAALLEVEVDGVENELLDGDINKGKYKEYICDTVPPENIIALYIPMPNNFTKTSSDFLLLSEQIKIIGISFPFEFDASSVILSNLLNINLSFSS